MSTDPCDPWRHVEKLPKDAPIWLPPRDWPHPTYVERRLRERGIDPASAGAIVSAILRRRWTFVLKGYVNPRPRFLAWIEEPRFKAPWAMIPGDTPAEALGAVLLLCLDNPPWQKEP